MSVLIEKFTGVDCIHCHAIFGLPEPVNKGLIKSGKSFYCPYCGGTQHYCEDETRRLKRRVRELQNSRDGWIKSYKSAIEDKALEKRRANGYKGQLKKTKNRISKGICPCCNEYFQKLNDRMKSEHPNYNKGEKNNDSKI